MGHSITAKKQPQKKLITAGNWATGICLIHCLGSSIIALSAPQLINVLPHFLWIEAFIAALAIISAYFMFKRAHCANFYTLSSLGLLSGGIIYSLIIHEHKLFTLFLCALALIQLFLTAKHHWPQKNTCCHHHGHHKQDEHC